MSDKRAFGNDFKTDGKLIYPVFYFLSLFLIIGCSLYQKSPEKIDRYTLVNRHNVIIEDFDSLNSLTVGNGKFAFTVDATGLQTFPELYKNGVCLGTQSEWGWHSFPNSGNFHMDETYQYFDVDGRKVPYAVQWVESERKRDAANYFRINPHRLNLGNIGLELLNSDNSLVSPGDISEIDQKLDLWKGIITSNFSVKNELVEVQTSCHPELDLIAVSISSELITKGQIGFRIRFPFPLGGHVDDASDWESTDKHFSEIVQQSSTSAILKHTIDSVTYFVKLNWERDCQIIQKDAHYYLLIPGSGSSVFSFSTEFSPENNFNESIKIKQIAALSEDNWKNFWENGGAVDFSETADPRAFELERRVVLSQYLTRIQCAGNYPPQETGLTFNSWYGKPHLEMFWWHGVHFALWNRTELLEKSVQYYFQIFEKANNKAQIQGYEGVRWPKMTDLYGNDSPSDIGEFLIWQQPHIIYFAELLYRHEPEKEVLEKYATLVFATADFMADFAGYEVENKRFVLGPPLIPAQERLEKEKTFNPPFELAYWKWGLSVAQTWRKRMGLPENEKWKEVMNGLPELAHKNGFYLAAESASDSYENKNYLSDHPMVLGAFGVLPGISGLDTVIMKATFDHIEKNWNWESTWGWDFPMAAMSATRLGKPVEALNFLLKDVQKNTYLTNGHNYQDKRLRIYLPGNGGLLTAIAMMCAGYEGSTVKNPGFPTDWKVKWENLQPVF